MSADNKLQQAANLIQTAQFDDAKKILKSILIKNPGKFDARYLLAIAEASIGNLGQADAELSKVLALSPTHYDAIYTKARILLELNEHAKALPLHDLSVQYRPNNPWAYLNRGNSLSALHSFERAIADFDKVIELDPMNPMGFCNKANCLRELGRHEQALDSYQKALDLDPDYAEAWSNRGVVLSELNRHVEALASHERAVEIDPTYAQAWTNRGAVLSELMRHQEALASHKRAVELEPDNAQAWSNQAVALNDLKRHQQALASCERALELKPDFAQAWCNRGLVLSDLHDHAGALASYDRAIELNPNYAQAWSNRALALSDLKRYRDAVTSYERAFALKPDSHYVLGDLIHTSMKICDWTDLGQRLQALKAQVAGRKTANAPFVVLGLCDDPALQRCASEAHIQRACPDTNHSNVIAVGQKGEKIRIGYFSADFHDHATMYLMAELFELHDRQQFEIYGFSFGPRTDSGMRQRAERTMDKFFDVAALSDEEIAQRSRDCQIDIAIDLKGHTQHARPQIFSHRAAPIQINFLGYPGTMGGALDYLIADTTLIPPECQPFYSEKIIYLPHCYQPNDSKRQISSRALTREEAGLPAQGFVFCCFNNTWKILPEVFDCWMQILQAVQGSVLWLLTDSPEAMNNLRQAAILRNVDPERLVFAPHIAHEEYLARYQLVDLFLDTSPCNAHTTASDALWGGAPVLTCQGKSFAARVASSLLHNMGLAELVVQTPEQYVALAIEIAQNSDKLRSIKATVSNHRLSTPLFDTSLFTSHLEAAYRLAHERLHANLAPDHLYVDIQEPTPDNLSL